MSKIYKAIVNNILDCKDREELHDVIWSAFYDKNRVCRKNCGQDLKIVILNAPCNGFGDLIFALKLSNYLRDWYNAQVTIATTLEKGLLGLGADPKYVVGLVGKEPSSIKNLQCRRFARLKMSKDLPKQDLIFIGPMQMDYDPNLIDVKKLLPYSNILNTFFFSEYNDGLDKGFDFNTGVGNDRDGLLLTKVPKKKKRLPALSNKYAIVYVAQSIGGVNKCISNFVQMVAKKYSKKGIKKFDIVVPPWFIDVKKHLVKKLLAYYNTISITILDKNKDNEPITTILGQNESSVKSVLCFKTNILPVSNSDMLELMKNSVKDILLTGDQSVSDALSCCPTKNVFYQVADWKKDFAYKMAKLLPNHYYTSIKTSCGGVKAVRYNSHYDKFVKKWGFKVLGKPKLDAIILGAIAMKNDYKIKELAEVVVKEQLRSVKNKLI